MTRSQTMSVRTRVLLVVSLLTAPMAVQAVRVGGLPVQTVSAAGACHPNDRWPVKTGTDADRGKVNLNSTTQTTVAAMDKLSPPSTFPPNNRIAPVETTVYSLSATLVKYQKMKDQDYHLVLTSGGHKLLVEAPDPRCVGSSSPFLPYISNVRSTVDSHLNVTTTSQSTSAPVTVRGVGFWDGKPGGGVHIELHPVLGITFN